MRSAAKKIAGLLMMMISVFLLLGGLYFNDDMAAQTVRTVLIVCGILLLCFGTVLYKLTKEE
ncbi:MAG: hypothetical protein IK990_14505 [Ruminiclostridium sp.]|nr:hypothetical protein [Ruminiclostridium sp.]